MSKLFYIAGIMALITGFVSGCVSLPDYRPDLPEDIGDKGLVVGEVVGIGRLMGWSMYKDVLIGGRKKGMVVNGFIAIPLSPGEYELTGFYSESYGGSSTYGNVTVTTRYTSSLPVKRKFTVRPKEVTNLGLLVLYPDPDDKEQKKFMRFFVDNSSDMKHFLKTSYPLLASKLRVDAMTMAPGDLLPDNLLSTLRKDLATKAALGAGGYATYVAAHAGALAEIQKDKENRVIGVKMIDVPTVSSLQSESFDHARDLFAFLTTNNRFFVVQNGRVSEKRPPAGLRAGKVYAHGKSDLVIVDDKFEIYTSRDGGDSWQAFLGAVTKDKANSRNASTGKNGFYPYNEYPAVLLYGSYGASQYQPVALPPEVKSLSGVTEKGSGLFVEKQVTVWTKDTPNPFFVRPAGGTAWETRYKPNALCGRIAFADADGMSLSVRCDKELFLSKDGGKTWQKK